MITIFFFNFPSVQTTRIIGNLSYFRISTVIEINSVHYEAVWVALLVAGWMSVSFALSERMRKAAVSVRGSS